MSYRGHKDISMQIVYASDYGKGTRKSETQEGI
jgi:hypothetical protein